MATRVTARTKTSRRNEEQEQEQEERRSVRPRQIPFLHSRPNPKKVREVRASQQRDQEQYDLWAAQRPSGGSGQSGGQLTQEQARKLQWLKQRKVKDLNVIREQMLHPVTPAPAPAPAPAPLTREEIREARLKALASRM